MRPQRRQATEVSPLFRGGKGDWVYSLTAVAAPHNGTTFIETCDISTKVVTDLMYNLGASLGFTKLKGVYDLQLEHFGIYRKDSETDMQYLIRVLNSSDFMSHNDNAIYDLTIDNALKINDGIEMQNNVYYFSVCGDATYPSGVSGNEVPDSSMLVLLKPFADSAQISKVAVDYVTALQRAGIICGKQNADGSFSYYPKSFATREQACKVLSLI